LVPGLTKGKLIGESENKPVGAAQRKGHRELQAVKFKKYAEKKIGQSKGN